FQRRIGTESDTARTDFISAALRNSRTVNQQKKAEKKGAKNHKDKLRSNFREIKVALCKRKHRSKSAQTVKSAREREGTNTVQANLPDKAEFSILHFYNLPFDRIAGRYNYLQKINAR